MNVHADSDGHLRDEYRAASRLSLMQLARGGAFQLPEVRDGRLRVLSLGHNPVGHLQCELRRWCPGLAALIRVCRVGLNV